MGSWASRLLVENGESDEKARWTRTFAGTYGRLPKLWSFLGGHQYTTALDIWQFLK